MPGDLDLQTVREFERGRGGRRLRPVTAVDRERVARGDHGLPGLDVGAGLGGIAGGEVATVPAGR